MRASTVTRMEVTPIAVAIPQAAQMIGRGIATIYELLGRNEIEAVKSDGRTLVKVSSLQAYIDRCPKAQITPRPRRKPQHQRQTETPSVQVAPPRNRKPQHLRQAATDATDNA